MLTRRTRQSSNWVQGDQQGSAVTARPVPATDEAWQRPAADAIDEQFAAFPLPAGSTHFRPIPPEG